MSDWPQKFLHAFKERHHYDSISAEHGDLSMDDAYDVQHRFVALRNEPISGYKAALTAAAAQQAMGIDRPIIGVLFASGAHSSAEPIQSGKPVLLETELGFRVARDINDPVDATQALDAVDQCIPMIELASPNLATQPNALDLIATNAASHAYFAGAPVAPDKVELDAIEISLHHDDEQLWRASSGDVLDGQRYALAFLINEALARGYAIQAGQLLMTGSIGGIAPAKPGKYVADFNELGTIEFTVAA